MVPCYCTSFCSSHIFTGHAVDFHVVLNGNYKAAASTDELGFYEIETVRVDLNIHIRCLHGKFSGFRVIAGTRIAVFSPAASS